MTYCSTCGLTEQQEPTVSTLGGSDRSRALCNNCWYNEHCTKDLVALAKGVMHIANIPRPTAETQCNWLRRMAEALICDSFEGWLCAVLGYRLSQGLSTVQRTLWRSIYDYANSYRKVRQTTLFGEDPK